jgi:hypothetical protein
MAAGAALAMQAQIADVSSPRRLLAGVEGEAYYPVLNADGTQMKYTSQDYQGLKLYDFVDNVTTKLSDAPRAGLSASFVAADAKVKVGVEGSNLLITRDGVTRSYSPVPCYAGYLWASLSPDGKKVMFVAAGKGIVITDLQGNVLSRPGKYEAPVWYGNDLIVAMDATDDGHQYRSSRIVLLRADGSEVQPLTRPESMSMFPAASATAGKIVYNTIDGLLYQLDVKLK